MTPFAQGSVDRCRPPQHRSGNGHQLPVPPWRQTNRPAFTRRQAVFVTGADERKAAKAAQGGQS